MDAFKVLFKNNVAVSAKRVQSNDSGIAELDMHNGKQVILWYILEADNETEAIELAAKIVEKVWDTVLGLSRRK